MLLYLSVHHVGVAPHLLGRYEFVELLYRKGLHGFLVVEQVLYLQGYDRIHLGLEADPVLEAGGIFPREHASQAPAVHGAVPYGGLSAHLACEPVVLDVLHREAVGGVVPAAEGLNIDELAGRYLIVYVPEVEVVVALDVFRLEFHAGGVRAGYHIEVQPQREQGYQHGGRHVRHHHAAIAHPSGQYGDDLGVRGHPRSEENHRDEHEQRREHVDEIGYEVQVVVEDDGIERRLVLHEVVDLLRDVEDYDYAYDEQQGHEEGQDELLRYIDIELLYIEIPHILELILATASFFQDA